MWADSTAVPLIPAGKSSATVDSRRRRLQEGDLHGCRGREGRGDGASRAGSPPRLPSPFLLLSALTSQHTAVEGGGRPPTAGPVGGVGKALQVARRTGCAPRSSVA